MPVQKGLMASAVATARTPTTTSSAPRGLSLWLRCPSSEGGRGRVWRPREVSARLAGLPFRLPPRGAASPRVPLAGFPWCPEPARGAGRVGEPRGLPRSSTAAQRPPRPERPHPAPPVASAA